MQCTVAQRDPPPPLAQGQANLSGWPAQGKSCWLLQTWYGFIGYGMIRRCATIWCQPNLKDGVVYYDRIWYTVWYDTSLRKLSCVPIYSISWYDMVWYIWCWPIADPCYQPEENPVTCRHRRGVVRYKTGPRKHAAVEIWIVLRDIACVMLHVIVMVLSLSIGQYISDSATFS